MVISNQDRLDVECEKYGLATSYKNTYRAIEWKRRRIKEKRKRNGLL